MAVFLTTLFLSLALADDPPKPFWQVDYERGAKSFSHREYVDVIRYFERALPKAAQDKAARQTEIIAEMRYGLGISYKALAEKEKNVWSRKTKYTAASMAFRRARSWYIKLRGPDDPIIIEITHELAEVHEFKILESDNLNSYFGQRPGVQNNIEGVWEAYLEVLAYKEKRLGPDDRDVVKYRNKIRRKLWTTIRRMRELIKSCKHEKWVYHAEAELSELEELADSLKAANKTVEEVVDQTTN